MGVKDKLKNIWKQSVASEVLEINKEVSSRAKKAPWYKKPTVEDLNLAYKDADKNRKN
tara:strand:- start:137 stop:310 length:174 start_codon:yes stop_codon:yes gene_type:complete